MNVEARMTDGVFMHDGDAGPKFDLEERTALFGEAIIGFAQGLPQNPINWPLINQLTLLFEHSKPI